MDNSKVKPSREEVLKKEIEFSNKIHARNVKEIAECSTHTDNFKIVNDKDRRLFLDAINFYCRDLCAVMFQLRENEIKIGVGEQSACDLRNVIVELSKIVVSLQELLNLELEEIKIQLKGILTNINSQDEKLVKIIGCDSLHEYKQKLLDSQLDMVIYTDAFKFYIQHCTLSLAEVERVAFEVIEKVRYNLHQIKSGHEPQVDDFVHYVRHSVHHLQKHVDHLRKLTNTEDFQNDVRDSLKRVGTFSDDFLGGILGVLTSDNPMEKMLDVIDNCHKCVAQADVEFQSIFKSDNEVLQDFIISIIVFGVTGLNAMNHSIEDAIMKK